MSIQQGVHGNMDRLAKTTPEIRRAFVALVRKTSLRMRYEIAASAPVGNYRIRTDKNGKASRLRLKQSFRVRFIDAGLAATIYSKAHHAHLVEFGTKAHKIPQPKRRRVLTHKGAAPQPYFVPAVERALQVFRAEGERILPGVFAKAVKP